MRRFYPLAVLAIAVGIGTWTLIVGGREPVAFLMLATIALGWVVWLVFRAAESLVRPVETVESAAVTGRRRKELEREKQALLKAIKELEFDHQMGKVSDKDFAEIGQVYRARAIRVLRRLDEGGQQYEALIAKEVAARLKKAPTDGKPAESGDGKPAGSGDGKAEAAASAPVVEDKAAAVENSAAIIEGRITCKGCGTGNDSDADFCKKCGTRLAATETAS